MILYAGYKILLPLCSHFGFSLSSFSCSFLPFALLALQKNQCAFSANLEFNRLLKYVQATKQPKKESKKNDLLSNKNMLQTFSYEATKKSDEKMLNSRMLFVREKMVKNAVIDILLSCCRKKGALWLGPTFTLLSVHCARSRKMVKWPIKFKYINSDTRTNGHGINCVANSDRKFTYNLHAYDRYNCWLSDIGYIVYGVYHSIRCMMYEIKRTLKNETQVKRCDKMMLFIGRHHSMH